MKRLVSFLCVFVLVLSFSVSAMAASYVPSIDAKPSPSVVVKDNGMIGAITNAAGEVIAEAKADAIVITPVGEAESSTEISAESKEKLNKVYQEIKEAEKLSEVFKEVKDADKMVVRDLFDITAVSEAIKEEISKGNVFRLSFNLSVKKDTFVVAMVYTDNGWKEVKVENNGDGTVTALFEELGTVAFLVSENEAGVSPATGDASSLTLWISLLAVSLALIVAIAVILRKKSVKQ